MLRDKNRVREALNDGTGNRVYSRNRKETRKLEQNREKKRRTLPTKIPDVMIKDRHLNLARHSSTVHPRRHVHRVAPDVVVRLLGADHTGHHGTDKEGGWDDTNKRKESLLDDTEEAGNEFHRVMQPQTLDTLVVSVQFNVELGEFGDDEVISTDQLAPPALHHGQNQRDEEEDGKVHAEIVNQGGLSELMKNPRVFENAHSQNIFNCDAMAIADVFLARLKSYFEPVIELWVAREPEQADRYGRHQGHDHHLEANPTLDIANSERKTHTAMNRRRTASKKSWNWID
ncbi:hypothetical protein PRIPAC_94955 [Pristionchus pacificus]|uniref:Uncharacterized protein n=1 Tax=Pristionchus pacificus TaxID=54126 RepID=A0A2A6BAX9_PRIPA|nr:hypothetical protein PRIPAC_94955 [Pristionchus pacificus]|eukprot:PDM63033.1 hypothetical protein PRIPAC_50248 [Pristionchus pacificus]